MPSAPKSRKTQSRKTFRISDSLNRQLNTYAQVACAAGVSVLALAGASEAKVVYTETNQVTQTGFPLYIDLNHDGIKDFLLRTSFYQGTSGLEIGLDASGYRADNVVAGRRFSRSGYFFSAASALPAGAEIGPNGNFSVRFPFMAEELFPKDGGSSQYSDLGPWANKGKGVKNRYLGLKFIVNGEVHYGWARLNVTLGHRRQFDDVSGVLTGYAYETEPDKPIIAGKMTGPDVITMQDDGVQPETVQPETVQPETLGGLALGRQ
jgi:hypothetical protein